MTKIILLSCAKKQAKFATQAKEMYQSPLFQKSLAYAEKCRKQGKVSAIYILSPKYDLVELGQKIAPYDIDLKKLPAEQRRQWGRSVCEQLKDVADLQKDTFVILAGQHYVKPLQKHLTRIEEPLEGMRPGERLSFLNKEIRK